MATQNTILLIEDDEKLSRLIKDFLERFGDFKVLTETRGDRARERIEIEKPILVVLDIMLPGLDGFTLCQQVRESYHGKVLMFSALSEEVDEITGLESGADDYLCKSASPRLLLARVNHLLKRKKAEAGGNGDNGTIAVGSMNLDGINRRVTINGRELALTTAEFDTLWFLANHAGRVVTRDELFQKTRGIEWDGEDRSIDLRIARLRKKLADDGRSPKWIKSIRGTGYLFTTPHPYQT